MIRAIFRLSSDTGQISPCAQLRTASTLMITGLIAKAVVLGQGGFHSP
jgi:hypothetical protein